MEKHLDFIRDLAQEFSSLGIILPQELNDVEGWVKAIKKWKKLWKTPIYQLDSC